jgi:acetoin utilization deacetylase AcuC-like enzyme
MPVAVVYSARYQIDIGLHVFPTRKYRLTLDRLLEGGVVDISDVVEPEAASWEHLGLVHTAEYLDKLRHGTLSSQEEAELELPWSHDLVESFRVMVGGTILAARLACADVSRPVCHLGGGLHHAFANHGEGFCPFNDVAVAIRVLQQAGIERHGVIDLDVHHGNGTAFIFESDPRVFTFSMHQQHNYPLFKPRGDLDIGLEDGAGDARYLALLVDALPRVMAHRPEIVFYLAGADPFEKDRLGGLKLTKEGLLERDRLVIAAARGAGVPLVTVLAGGYAADVQDTVDIHCNTIEAMAQVP